MIQYNDIITSLTAQGSLRTLPAVTHNGKYIIKDGNTMLNLSGNDYLGLGSNKELRCKFLSFISDKDIPFTSASSRLLTGNYTIYTELEQLLAMRFGREAALLFNSGYHANIGILPAVADKQTLILADKLVHASIIDGIRLSGAPFLRYRHNDYDHLTQLLQKEQGKYRQYIVVTESIFSMDGDIADLRALVALKEFFPDLLLYVDEAHAVGVRGACGLGVAEETGCISEIDFLVGTFGKALASVGAYVICSEIMKQYLINTMRPLIFSTALPPVNIAWSYYIFEQLDSFKKEREQLTVISTLLRNHLFRLTGQMISNSHIVPFIVGQNDACIAKATELQQGGFYSLPVRPPTVLAGTSRIRFSLAANQTIDEINALINILR